MSYLDLSFDAGEMALIAAAWKGGVFDWNHRSLQAIRSKIRDLFRASQGDRCCYCQKTFMGDHSLGVDIEHVLPKSVFKEFAINSLNLAVACKRCNMGIKKARVDFLHGLDVDSVKLIFDKSDSYEFIHPNLDDPSEHLSLIVASIGRHALVRYLVAEGSSKGAKTVDYFQLRSLEVDRLDEIQGLNGRSGSERAAEVRMLLGVS